jgi:hypothetical protein
MTDDAEAPAKPRKRRRKLVGRLVRLAIMAAAGVLIAKQLKQRSAPAEGLWSEGLSGNGQGSGDRR